MADDNKTYMYSDAGLNDRKGQEWFNEVQKMSDAVEKLTNTVESLSDSVGGNSGDSFFSTAAKKLFGAEEQKASIQNKLAIQQTKAYTKQLENVGLAIGAKLAKKVEDSWDKKMEIQSKKLTLEERMIQDLARLTEKLGKNLVPEMKDGKFVMDDKEMTSQELLTYLRKNNDPAVRAKFNKDIYDYIDKKSTDKNVEDSVDKETKKQAVAKRVKKTDSVDEQERKSAETEQEQEAAEARDIKSVSLLEEMGKLFKTAFGAGGIMAGMKAEFKSGNSNLFSGMSNVLLKNASTIIGSVLKGFSPMIGTLLKTMGPMFAKLGAVAAVGVISYRIAREFSEEFIVPFIEKLDAKRAARAQKIEKEGAAAETEERLGTRKFMKEHGFRETKQHKQKVAERSLKRNIITRYKKGDIYHPSMEEMNAGQLLALTSGNTMSSRNRLTKLRESEGFMATVGGIMGGGDFAFDNERSGWQRQLGQIKEGGMFRPEKSKYKFVLGKGFINPETGLTAEQEASAKRVPRSSSETDELKKSYIVPTEGELKQQMTEPSTNDAAQRVFIDALNNFAATPTTLDDKSINGVGAAAARNLQVPLVIQQHYQPSNVPINQ